MRYSAGGITRFFALAVLSLSACTPTEIDQNRQREKSPNVVLVVLDTVRADALSCYGNPRQTTPHTDRLAAGGVRFDNAYSTCFWTLPSHASLFTGLYPSQASATSETNHLPERLTTLAEHLVSEEYRTAAVVRNAWISAERGFAQGFDLFVEDWREDSGDEATDEREAVELAIEWIGENAGEEEPFFLFINLNVAHLPYTPPEPTRVTFASEQWSQERIDRMMSIEGGWGHFTGNLKLDDRDFRLLRDLYEAEVSIADEHVGLVLDAIKDLGVLDQTLIIVTSDHGENLGDHGLIDHVFSLYDTTVRVPLIVRYPRRFEAGQVVDDLVSLVDVFPTVLEVTGSSPVAGGLSGVALGNPRAGEHTAVYAENGRPINGVRLLKKWFPDFDTSTIDHPMRMIRSGTFKLIWTADVSAELFDLEADPGELSELASARPDLRRSLLEGLRAWSLALEPRVTPHAFESRDRQSLDRLRALGYVE
jgi:arylsulfatase A-like enzyme